MAVAVLRVPPPPTAFPDPPSTRAWASSTARASRAPTCARSAYWYDIERWLKEPAAKMPRPTITYTATAGARRTGSAATRRPHAGREIGRRSAIERQRPATADAAQSPRPEGAPGSAGRGERTGIRDDGDGDASAADQRVWLSRTSTPPALSSRPVAPPRPRARRLGGLRGSNRSARSMAVPARFHSSRTCASRACRTTYSAPPQHSEERADDKLRYRIAIPVGARGDGGTELRPAAQDRAVHAAEELAAPPDAMHGAQPAAREQARQRGARSRRRGWAKGGEAP